MTQRAKRPLDPAAVAKADDAFYAAHPQMIEGGRRNPISAQPDDPCAASMREEWMRYYVAAGGVVDPVTLPAAKPGSTTLPCQSAKQTLTELEARRLFNELAANKNIPFDYPVDCCYSRAHSMCRMIEQKNIVCQKIWYFDKNFGTLAEQDSLKPIKADGTPVAFPGRHGFARHVAWVYHVAPTVKVVRNDGTTQDMVMDPSLSNRPLTKSEWKQIQGNPPGAYEEETDSAAYFSNKKKGWLDEDPDLRLTCVELERHKEDRNLRRAAQAKRARNL
jgi:hypothetical protein